MFCGQIQTMRHAVIQINTEHQCT